MSASLIAVSSTNSRHGAGCPSERGPCAAASWWCECASAGTGAAESITVIGRNFGRLPMAYSRGP
jgi:hypothetical protein